MCGIVGLLDYSARHTQHELDSVVRKMADTLTHRGPDDSGTWVEPENGLALGHRRLSIIDLSPAGHQPMVSRDSNLVLVFNGEIYNHKLLRTELLRAGVTFRGTSDTEVLLEALALWGTQRTLQRLNGMFAFAAWNRRERKLTLARDRAGEKPLYYAALGSTLVFASELKALRAHHEFSTEIDRESLVSYLRHGYVPAPHSIYSAARKLPVASFLEFGAGLSSEPVQYWSLRDAAVRGQSMPLGGTEAELADELERRLKSAVLGRMEADVPLGAFLSGGVDSSTVVALMQAQSDRPVRTFTIGFNESAYDEAQYAKEVAHHLGTDHTELYVTGEEAMAVIPKLPAIYDEPFGDSSQIPTFLVSELARRHVTVALSGDAGDELFGGYVRYRWLNQIYDGARCVPRPFRSTIAKGISALRVETWDHLYARIEGALPNRLRQSNPGQKLHKVAKILPLRDMGEMYFALVSSWVNPESAVVNGKERLSAIVDSSSHLGLEDRTSQLMYWDTITYLPDDILVKLDRASMRVSLESRVPLLDHELIEFAWSLPKSFRFSPTQSKVPLRKVLYRYVPQALIDRPKMGFGVPLQAWLRGPLRDWANGLLDAERLRREGFLNAFAVAQKWHEHQSGKRDWEYLLWNVLMFQAWLENQKCIN